MGIFILPFSIIVGSKRISKSYITATIKFGYNYTKREDKNFEHQCWKLVILIVCSKRKKFQSFFLSKFFIRNFGNRLVSHSEICQKSKTIPLPFSPNKTFYSPLLEYFKIAAFGPGEKTGVLTLTHTLIFCKKCFVNTYPS